MEIIYFLVKNSDYWDSDYHENFFDVQGAFWWGFIAALIVGVLVSIIFYFCLCNSKKSSKYATISVWAISMVIAAIVSYFCADLVKMKPQDDNSLFWKSSFCYANEVCYYNTVDGQSDQNYIDDLVQKKDEIKDDISKYKDVRFEYDITTAVLAVLFFFLASLVVKRFTINGRTIPFLKPLTAF